MEDALAIMRSMESRGKICRRNKSGGGGVCGCLFGCSCLYFFVFLARTGWCVHSRVRW